MKTRTTFFTLIAAAALTLTACFVQPPAPAAPPASAPTSQAPVSPTTPEAQDPATPGQPVEAYGVTFDSQTEADYFLAAITALGIPTSYVEQEAASDPAAAQDFANSVVTGGYTSCTLDRQTFIDSFMEGSGDTFTEAQVGALWDAGQDYLC